MIISHKKNFIFIHIYKTGGTTVTKPLLPHARFVEKFSTFWSTRYFISLINKVFNLGDYGNRWINGVHKHAKATEIRDYLGKNTYKKYFKFSIVRNPYDLQVSLYHYIKQTKGHRDYEIANELSFKQFVYREMDNNAPIQYDFLSNEDDELIVDYIGKTEKLQKSFDEICGKIDIRPIDLGRKNKSNRDSNYMKYYDEELKKDVYNYFKKDFEAFNYS